ncbi:hypothetical protein ABZU25_33735 [Micromonospora sp. NPDC005215]
MNPDLTQTRPGQLIIADKSHISAELDRAAAPSKAFVPASLSAYSP